MQGRFFDATTHLLKRSCPWVRPSARGSHVTSEKGNFKDFEKKKGKCSNNITHNATIVEEEVVASHGPPRFWFESCKISTLT